MNTNQERQTHSFGFLSGLVLASGMLLLSAQLYAQQSAPSSQPKYQPSNPGNNRSSNQDRRPTNQQHNQHPIPLSRDKPEFRSSPARS